MGLLPVCVCVLVHPLHPAGVKQGLGLLSRYLYVVTDDTSPDGAARSQLQVLDVKNKLVAGGWAGVCVCVRGWGAAGKGEGEGARGVCVCGGGGEGGRGTRERAGQEERMGGVGAVLQLALFVGWQALAAAIAAATCLASSAR